MTLNQHSIGNPEVHLLQNERGVAATLTTLGARLMSIQIPHPERGKVDVLLGHPTPLAYASDPHYLGAIVGRCCNRIGDAEFRLNGVVYELAANEGRNQLHGGQGGFHCQRWELKEGANEGQAELYLRSEDGDQGYPGALEVWVRYSLTADSCLRIDYRARCDQDTVVNLTSHGYFNLAGSGDVSDHWVQIHADAYTPTNDSLIPTGEIASVASSPFDLRQGLVLGERLPKSGFDTNYVIPGSGVREMARVRCATSGISMVMSSSQPGCQFYTGDHLASDGVFLTHGGLCLEAQNYPDAINQPGFPSPVLRAGEEYTHTTMYRFEW